MAVYITLAALEAEQKATASWDQLGRFFPVRHPTLQLHRVRMWFPIGTSVVRALLISLLVSR
jgi:hypothetical protein